MLPSAQDTGCWCCTQPSAFVLGKDGEGFPGSCQAPKLFSSCPSGPQLLGQGRGEEPGCPPAPLHELIPSPAAEGMHREPLGSFHM